MGFRVGEDDVRDIITVANQDELDSNINLASFIRTANLLVNKISSNDSSSLLSSGDLKEIEAYLAAHFYTFRDQQYESTKSDDASDKYQGKTGMYFDSSFYGQTAKMLDVTGYLGKLQEQAIKGKRTVGITWLGKPKSQQIKYENRD